MRDFSTKSLNRLADEATEKDALLEYISAHIKKNALTAADLQRLSPGIHRNKLALLREQDRSAGSVELLRELAQAIESAETGNESGRAAPQRREQKDHDRDPVAEAVRAELLEEIARRARMTTTAEMKTLMPNICQRNLTDLRNAKPGFGWDRINAAAVRLGVDVGSVWSKHQRPQQQVAA